MVKMQMGLARDMLRFRLKAATNHVLCISDASSAFLPTFPNITFLQYSGALFIASSNEKLLFCFSTL